MLILHYCRVIREEVSCYEAITLLFAQVTICWSLLVPDWSSALSLLSRLSVYALISCQTSAVPAHTGAI